MVGIAFAGMVGKTSRKCCFQLNCTAQSKEIRPRVNGASYSARVFTINASSAGDVCVTVGICEKADKGTAHNAISNTFNLRMNGRITLVRIWQSIRTPYHRLRAACRAIDRNESALGIDADTTDGRNP